MPQKFNQILLKFSKKKLFLLAAHFHETFFFFQKSSQMTKVWFSHFKLFLLFFVVVFSLRFFFLIFFLFFFFFPQCFLYRNNFGYFLIVVDVVAVAVVVVSLRKSRSSSKKKTKSRKTWRCFMNAREIIDKNIKFLFFLLSLVVYTNSRSESFFSTTNVHRFATTTHRHRRRFSCSRSFVECCVFPSFPLVCVKVAMCVFFVFSTTTVVSQETLLFYVVWENRGAMKKKEFCENWKKFQYWWFSAFMWTCRVLQSRGFFDSLSWKN